VTNGEWRVASEIAYLGLNATRHSPFATKKATPSDGFFNV
jgi:hypothetical protein